MNENHDHLLITFTALFCKCLEMESVIIDKDFTEWVEEGYYKWLDDYTSKLNTQNEIIDSMRNKIINEFI